MRWNIYLSTVALAAIVLGVLYQLLRHLFPFFGVTTFLGIYAYCKGLSLVLDWGGELCDHRSRRLHRWIGWSAGALGAYAAWVVWLNLFLHSAAQQAGTLPPAPVLLPWQVIPILCGLSGRVVYGFLGHPIGGFPITLIWVIETALLTLLPPFFGGTYIISAADEAGRARVAAFRAGHRPAKSPIPADDFEVPEGWDEQHKKP